MKPDKALDRLGEDFDLHRTCPALLDVSAVDAFLVWLDDHLDFFEQLENRQVRIGMLRRHVEARHDRAGGAMRGERPHGDALRCAGMH